LICSFFIIKHLGKSNKPIGFFIQVNACNDIFLFIKISATKVSNSSQQITSAFFIEKWRNILIDVGIVRNFFKGIHIYFSHFSNDDMVIFEVWKCIK